jgi:hypothetical protein
MNRANARRKLKQSSRIVVTKREDHIELLSQAVILLYRGYQGPIAEIVRHYGVSPKEEEIRWMLTFTKPHCIANAVRA